MNCLTEDQLIALVDGGIAPNERGSFEDHLAGCASCREALLELETLAGDVTALALLDGVDEEAHVASVMARLGESRPEVDPSRSAKSRWPLVGGVVSAVAMAAVIALFVRDGKPVASESSFAARGGPSEPSLARDVGVHVFTGMKNVTTGATIEREASFSGVYSNLHGRAAYLLLFAVDSAGDVHWLYPAYESATDDPSSIALPPAAVQVALPTSVVLEKPAAGALRFVSVVTESPLHVHDIEDRRADALEKSSLERAFPRAVVSELVVSVKP